MDTDFTSYVVRAKCGIIDPFEILWRRAGRADEVTEDPLWAFTTIVFF
jgi:hypothetical protein